MISTNHGRGALLASLMLAACSGVATGAKAKPAPTTDTAAHGPVRALRLSIQELKSRFGARYPAGQIYLDQLVALENEQPAVAGDAQQTAAWQTRFDELQYKALVTDNPYIDFTEVLAVRRNQKTLGLPQNWQGNTSVNPKIENELIRFEVKNKSAAKTLYKPAEPWFVGDVNLHFNADRLLFSSIGKNLSLIHI